MNCIICREEFLLLSKICICNDSLVCGSCVNEMNISQIFKCPYCRRKLELNLSNNFLKMLLYLFFILILPTTLLLFQLIPINYMLKTQNISNTYILDNYFWQKIIIYVSFLIIQPINFYFYLDFFKNRIQTFFYINKIFIFFTFSLLYCILMNLIILYYGEIDPFKNILFFFIIPSQFIPFMYIFINLTFGYICNLIKIIKKKQ